MVSLIFVKTMAEISSRAKSRFSWCLTDIALNGLREKNWISKGKCDREAGRRPMFLVSFDFWIIHLATSQAFSIKDSGLGWNTFLVALLMVQE